MDSQDHKNSTDSTGREIHGVQLCHRCGWPFPNPHPSARHRRSHKKVCGKIEGYKLIESEAENASLAVSDDEHSSDEDHRTPSPKAEKKNIKEFDSSGGGGEKSNRSEYEVFAGAVADFSDSGISHRLDEHLESVSDKSVEKVMVDDLNRNQLLKSDETAKTTKQLNDPTSSSQTCKLEYEMDQLESIITPSDTTSETVSVGFANALQSDTIKSESQTDIISDNINKDGDKKMQQERVSAREFVDARGEKGESYLKSSDSGALDSEEGKTSDLNVIVVDREEKLCDKLDTEVVKHEVYTQNEGTENMDSFVEVKRDADSATDINVESDHKLIEICKSENGLQLHFENLPGENIPEVIIEDFKDHKYIQSKLPLDLSSAEITRPIEAVDEGNIAEECLRSHSVNPVGSMPSSSVALSDSNVVEDNLKVEADTSTLTATNVSVETYGFEVQKVTSGAEIQSNCSTRGLQSHSVDSSKNALSEYSPVNDSNILSIVSSTSKEVKQKTDVHGDENAKNCDICKSDKGVTVGNERSNGDSEEVLCVESKPTPVHADKSFAPKDDQTTMVLVEDSNHCDEKSSSMLLDAGNGRGEVGPLGNLTNNGEAKNVYSMQSLDPTDFLTSDRSTKLPISEDMAPLLIDSESLKQKSAEETSCADDGAIESEPVDAAGMEGELNHDRNIVKISEHQDKHASIVQESMPAGQECLNETSAADNGCTSDKVSTLKSVGIDSGVELIHDGDIVALDNNSPVSITEEPEAPPSDSEVLNKSSGTVDGIHITSGEKGSGVSYEPLEDEPDDKLTKRKDGNSSVFISGASSSPTESLEGNWGS
ncbi:to-interacting 1, partial, partial [Olea europaea subsp. europaea]